MKWGLFLLILATLLLLPNFSFAKINFSTSQNLLIQEIKTEGISASSHYGEWIEITNSSNNAVNLADFCLVSKKETNNTLASYNCFPVVNVLPQEIIIVTYSGYDFLQDNQFDLDALKDALNSGDNLTDLLGGYLFELGDNTSSVDASFFSQKIPNLLNISKSRLYLGDDNGEIFLFKKNTQEIIDQTSWLEEIDKDKSLVRPVYNSEIFPWEITTPSPFKIFPLFVKLETANITYTEASFQFKKIFDPLINVPEKISLFEIEGGKNELIREENSISENINYSNLFEDTSYRLNIEAKISEKIIFSLEINFQTLKHFPKLLLNELYPDPKTGEDEFIELYNPNNFPVDLNSWSLKDKANNSFSLSGQIQAQDFLIVYPTFALNNDEEKIFLLDPALFIQDQVNYINALDGYSYSLFENIWQWSRLITPNAKNQIIPLYLPETVDSAKQIEDKVQVKGKIVIPPQSFASYFYLGEGSSALKIESTNKLNFKEGECLLIYGEIKQEKEPYLSLENYKILPSSSCLNINFSQIENFHNLAQLISTEADIFSEGGSYFINFEGTKIKLRTSSFKLQKGKAKIKGVLGFGAKYYQLFILKSDWVEYESLSKKTPSPNGKLTKNQSQKQASLNAFNLGQIKSQVYNYQDFSDQRLKEENYPVSSYVIWLAPYYLGILIFGSLAKILFFA